MTPPVSSHHHLTTTIRIAKARLHRLIDRYEREWRSYERMLSKVYPDNMLLERIDELNKSENFLYENLKKHFTKHGEDFNLSHIFQQMYENKEVFDLDTFKQIDSLVSKIKSVHKELSALQNIERHRHRLKNRSTYGILLRKSIVY